MIADVELRSSSTAFLQARSSVRRYPSAQSDLCTHFCLEGISTTREMPSKSKLRFRSLSFRRAGPDPTSSSFHQVDLLHELGSHEDRR